MTKIEKAIEQLRKAETLALKYQSFGFHLAFSGGKDSQTIYELAKMAGVKFKAFMYLTSVDPQELIRFVKNNYPDVELWRPAKTMYQLILQKKMLPMRNRRYCCEVIKERNGLDAVVITGIRKAESPKRKKRKSFETSCKLGKDKILVNPILDWTDNDVFSFLKQRNIPLCNLYIHFCRIGCIGCPMNSKNQRKEFMMFPNHRKAYINTIEKLRTKHNKYLEFESAEDALNWWTSGISRKKYLANKKQMKFPYWDEVKTI